MADLGKRSVAATDLNTMALNLGSIKVVVSSRYQPSASEG